MYVESFSLWKEFFGITIPTHIFYFQSHVLIFSKYYCWMSLKDLKFMPCNQINVNALKLSVAINMYKLHICLNVFEYKRQINVNIILWPGMKLIRWIWIVNSNKYVEAIYLAEIKCMMNFLVTKVVKFIRLFNSKLIIISITHKIIDAKLYDYWFMGN